jgi:uncharacterized protein (TIGR03083 family)
MTLQQDSVDTLARSFALTASAAFGDQAEYFRTLPEEAWSSPTGCAKWTMHDLAGHIAGEAIWFPNLVRSVTEDAPPLPDKLWEQLKRTPGKELADKMAEGAQGLRPAVDGATSEQLEQTVNLGFTAPLWQALYVCMFEAVLHNWDGRARRDPAATIPETWARELVASGDWFAPMLANKDAAEEAAGRYLLDVGNGVGPITVVASEGGVTFERGRVESPDLTANLTPDQYVRLLAGRLPLDKAIDIGEVTVDGDAAQALGLNRIFAGVGS